MATKKTMPAQASSTAPQSSRRARYGADEHTASRKRTAATKRAIEASAAHAVHATGENLVEKSTAGVVQLTHDQHPGFDSHRKGHPIDQEVKSLAHMFTQWANVRVNGSGILAAAAWSKRLEEAGKQGIREAGRDLEPFIRGLIHR